MVNKISSTAPNIKIARVEDGWAWAVITDDGDLASGCEVEQGAAMEAAWRVAQSFVPAPRKVFPEIIVEPGLTRVSRAARPSIAGHWPQ